MHDNSSSFCAWYQSSGAPDVQGNLRKYFFIQFALSKAVNRTNFSCKNRKSIWSVLGVDKLCELLAFIFLRSLYRSLGSALTKLGKKKNLSLNPNVGNQQQQVGSCSVAESQELISGLSCWIKVVYHLLFWNFVRQLCCFIVKKICFCLVKIQSYLFCTYIFCFDAGIIRDTKPQLQEAPPLPLFFFLYTLNYLLRFSKILVDLSVEDSLL